MEQLLQVISTVTRTSVEVFKTNVRDKPMADQIIYNLLQTMPGYEINFDLEDCDKILRIKGNEMDSKKIILLLSALGVYSEVLN